MLARYLFLAVIALGALVAAANLAPGDLERLAMLERDGRHEQAMGELQRLYEAGDRSPQVMLRLYNLKIRFGEVDQAQAVLEEYARRRPNDVEAHIGLIRFYQTNQLEGPYLTALRNLQERTRSKELLAELLSFYRMTGRFREEEDLLERVARANRAGPAEFERLGLLAAARGDLQRAVRALRRADGRLDDQSRPARLGLFRSLIELKATDEAHQRCLVWLRAWRDPEMVVEFMDSLTDAARVDLALDIGNRFGGPGSDASLVSAELLQDQGKPNEALQRLRDYQSAGLPEDPHRAQRFIGVAASAGGVDMAVRAARLIGLRKLETGTIIDLLDAIQDALEPGKGAIPVELLKGFSGEIEARILNVTPLGREATDALVLPSDLRLFATQLALLDQDRDLARRHLAAVNPDRLNSDDLARWTELQLASGLRSTAFPNLPRAWSARGRGEFVVRRLSRPDRPAGAAGADSQPTRPRLGDGTTGAAPAASGQAASAGRDAQTLANAHDGNAARARRARRRAIALERQRERARLATQRRDQQRPQNSQFKTFVPGSGPTPGLTTVPPLPAPGAGG